MSRHGPSVPDPPKKRGRINTSMPPTAITTTIYAETLCHTVLSGEPTSRFRLKCLGGFLLILDGKRRFMQNERILTLRGAT